MLLRRVTHDAELAETFSSIAKDLHGCAQTIDTEPREGAVRELSLIVWTTYLVTVWWVSGNARVGIE